MTKSESTCDNMHAAAFELISDRGHPRKVSRVCVRRAGVIDTVLSRHFTKIKKLFDAPKIHFLDNPYQIMKIIPRDHRQIPLVNILQ